MQTQVNTIVDLKNVITEMVVNKTTKVNKISDHSVLNAILFGVAKIGQKSQKDCSIVESELFPEYSYGKSLDLIAWRQGFQGRKLASPSSTYVRVGGTAGTYYDSDFCLFVDTVGRKFKAAQNWTIPVSGYTYVLVTSILKGEAMNVSCGTIVSMLNPPPGHLYVNNDFNAVGGSDSEPDDLMKERLISGYNVLAMDTLERLRQIMMTVNPDVLDVRKLGKNSKGESIIAIVTQSGSDLSGSELAQLKEDLSKSLCLSDIRSTTNQLSGIQLQNMQYSYIDVDFRVDLYEDTDLPTFTAEIQRLMFEYLDWRVWGDKNRVEWDDLFDIVKHRREVRYIPDQFFIPRKDIVLETATLPRIRTFIMRSLGGQVMARQDDPKFALNVFYQRRLDYDFKMAVLSNI